MPDINFSRSFNSSGNVVYGIGDQPATGNKLLMNNFEKTFLSNLTFGDAFGVPYGGNALNFIGASYNPDDLDTINALAALAVDQTVKSMLGDPLNISKPNTEKLQSASLLSIDITTTGSSAIKIKIVPVERQDDTTLTLLF